MRSPAVATLTVLAALLLHAISTQAADKKVDSSTLSTPPIYDQTGVLSRDHGGDFFTSFTDAHGNTSSVNCSTAGNSVACHEGTGITNWVTLPDGRKLYFWTDRPAVDLDHSDGAGGFALIHSVNEPLVVNGEGQFLQQVIHFRLRSIRFGVATFRYFCMPLNVNLTGKERAAFAKHHSMEACYKYQTGAE